MIAAKPTPMASSTCMNRSVAMDISNACSGEAPPSTGVSAMPVATLKARRTRAGTSWLPNIGTTMKKPATRRVFQRNSPMRPIIAAILTVKSKHPQPNSMGIAAKICSKWSSSSPRIHGPATMMVSSVTSSLGRKLNVCSLIWVAA